MLNSVFNSLAKCLIINANEIILLAKVLAFLIKIYLRLRPKPTRSSLEWVKTQIQVVGLKTVEMHPPIRQEDLTLGLNEPNLAYLTLV